MNVRNDATKIARAETFRTRRSSREHKDSTALRSNTDLLTNSFNECNVGRGGDYCYVNINNIKVC